MSCPARSALPLPVRKLDYGPLNRQQRRRLRVKGTAGASVAAMSAVAFLGSVAFDAPRAFADPPPPVSASYYVSTTNSTTVCSWGTALGQAVLNQPGTQLEFAILQFGAPKQFSGTSWGATLYSPASAQTTATIKALSETFAQCFFYGTGADVTSDLILSIGTSDDNSPQVTTAHGTAWGNMSNNAQNDLVLHGYSSQATITGGSDLEPPDVTGAWSTYATVHNWMVGYQSVANPGFVNNGATQCPTSGTFVAGTSCGTGWSAENEYVVNWTGAAVAPAPQIYANDSSMAKQEAGLAAYALSAHGTQEFFWASLTQYKACLQTGCDPSIDNTAAMGYNQLKTQLGNHPGVGTTVFTATDIRW